MSEWGSPEWQARNRAWLQQKMQPIDNAYRGLLDKLDYYIPGDYGGKSFGQSVDGLLNFTKEASPGADVRDMRDGSRQTMQGLLGGDMSQAGQGVGTMTLGAIGTMPGFGDLAKMGLMGIFAGRGAKTADVLALSKAEKMAKKGISRDEIWKDTGWFQGADGKWRFEIDDSKSAIKKGARRAIQDFGVRKQSSILDHEDLYNAYPNTKDIHNFGLSARNTLDGTQGIYYADTTPERIDINWRGLKGNNAVRDVNLHEVQHAIQQREGFARGGTPEMFVENLSDEAKALRKQSLEKLTKLQFYKSMTKYGEDAAKRKFKLIYGEMPSQSILDGAARLSDEWIAKSIDDYSLSPYEKYRRLAGEVEARNVQARKDLTATQRKSTPPWKTQDTPDEQQMIKGLFGNE